MHAKRSADRLRPFIPSVVAALAFLFAGCGAKDDLPAIPAAPAIPVTVTAATEITTPRFVEVPGTIRPVERATLSAKVMGTIVSIPVTLGQPVSRGDRLLDLSAAEIDARVAQAEAHLEQVSRDLERENSLLAEGATTTAMVRTLESQKRAATAALAEAKTMLGYTRITAPFDGVITARPLNEGDLATPGLRLLEIEGTSHLRVETEVPESLGIIAPGATITVVASGREIEGRLAEISTSADTLSRTVFAKIDLPADAAVRSGQFVRARFPAGESRALVVPASAVTTFGQMERVFVLSDSRAVLRLVRTGRHHGDLVEILSGITAGESVITEIPAGLRDGQPAEIRP